MKKTTTFKRFMLVMLAVLMIASFSMMAACEKSGGDAATTPAASDGDEGPDITKPTEVTGKDIYNEPIKLLYVPIGDAGPAYEMGVYALKDSLKFTPNITLDVKPGEYDPTKQAAILQEGVTQGYDAIFAECMDPVVSAGPVEAAEAAGIPFISINLNSEAVHTLHIQGNDYKSGQEAAKILGAALGGKGKVLTGNGPAAQQATNQMVVGFNEGIAANYPDIEILGDLPTEGWQADEANKQMSDALTKYDTIDGVYCASDDIADGYISALTTAGREKDTLVYGSMGYPAALQRIKDGTQFGSYFSDVYGEYQTIIYQALYFIENGISSKSLGLKSTPLLDQPTTPITKDGKIEGSVDVQTVIDNSRWKTVMPDAFK
ncbi:MAG: sugar ABC transporter substrate-binding protein [Clostridiales Family XIII bacterium]|nr:sugar ABC transporter substrate-binding protein [Clostridiales Family XIII bacterium]